MIFVALLMPFQADTRPSSTNPIASISQAQLDAMSDKCHAPRAWLKQLGGDQVRFQPSPDGKYAKVDCVLKRLEKSAYPMKLGFIGNEAFSEDGGHK